MLPTAVLQGPAMVSSDSRRRRQAASHGRKPGRKEKKRAEKVVFFLLFSFVFFFFVRFVREARKGPVVLGVKNGKSLTGGCGSLVASATRRRTVAGATSTAAAAAREMSCEGQKYCRQGGESGEEEGAERGCGSGPVLSHKTPPSVALVVKATKRQPGTRWQARDILKSRPANEGGPTTPQAV